MPISFENADSVEVMDNAGEAQEGLLRQKIERLERELEEARQTARLGEDLIGVLMTKLEVAEQEKNTNPVTGLPNGRALENFVEKRREKSEGGVFVMGFADINDFKNINETYGHEGGDVVLGEVGRRLQSMIREDDILSHPHGDEFIMTFSGTSEEGLAKHFEGAQLSFEVDYGGKKIPVGLTIGLTTYTPGEPLADAKRRADEKMFSAKHEFHGKE